MAGRQQEKKEVHHHTCQTCGRKDETVTPVKWVTTPGGATMKKLCRECR